MSAAPVKTAGAMPVYDVRCKCAMQGSLLDNQELLESLNQAKAKAATINASLQESRNVQVSLCTLQTVPGIQHLSYMLKPTGCLDCTMVRGLSSESSGMSQFCCTSVSLIMGATALRPMHTSCHV
jgi:hypothetical protein